MTVRDKSKFYKVNLDRVKFPNISYVLGKARDAYAKQCFDLADLEALEKGLASAKLFDHLLSEYNKGAIDEQEMVNQMYEHVAK